MTLFASASRSRAPRRKAADSGNPGSLRNPPACPSAPCPSARLLAWQASRPGQNLPGQSAGHTYGRTCGQTFGHVMRPPCDQASGPVSGPARPGSRPDIWPDIWPVRPQMFRDCPGSGMDMSPKRAYSATASHVFMAILHGGAALCSLFLLCSVPQVRNGIADGLAQEEYLRCPVHLCFC